MINVLAVPKAFVPPLPPNPPQGFFDAVQDMMRDFYVNAQCSVEADRARREVAHICPRQFDCTPPVPNLNMEQFYNQTFRQIFTRDDGTVTVDDLMRLSQILYLYAEDMNRYNYCRAHHAD